MLATNVSIDDGDSPCLVCGGQPKEFYASVFPQRAGYHYYWHIEGAGDFARGGNTWDSFAGVDPTGSGTVSLRYGADEGTAVAARRAVGGTYFSAAVDYTGVSVEIVSSDVPTCCCTPAAFEAKVSVPGSTYSTSDSTIEIQQYYWEVYNAAGYCIASQVGPDLSEFVWLPTSGGEYLVTVTVVVRDTATGATTTCSAQRKVARFTVSLSMKEKVTFSLPEDPVTPSLPKGPITPPRRRAPKETATVNIVPLNIQPMRKDSDRILEKRNTFLGTPLKLPIKYGFQEEKALKRDDPDLRVIQVTLTPQIPGSGTFEFQIEKDIPGSAAARGWKRLAALQEQYNHTWGSTGNIRLWADRRKERAIKSGTRYRQEDFIPDLPDQVMGPLEIYVEGVQESAHYLDFCWINVYRVRGDWSYLCASCCLLVTPVLHNFCVQRYKGHKGKAAPYLRFATTWALKVDRSGKITPNRVATQVVGMECDAAFSRTHDTFLERAGIVIPTVETRATVFRKGVSGGRLAFIQGVSWKNTLMQNTVGATSKLRMKMRKDWVPKAFHGKELNDSDSKSRPFYGCQSTGHMKSPPMPADLQVDCDTAMTQDSPSIPIDDEDIWYIKRKPGRGHAREPENMVRRTKGKPSQQPGDQWVDGPWQDRLDFYASIDTTFQLGVMGVEGGQKA